MKELVRRGYLVYASGDVDDLDAVMAEDYVDHSPVPGQRPGRDGVKAKVADSKQASKSRRSDAIGSSRLPDRVWSDDCHRHLGKMNRPSGLELEEQAPTAARGEHGVDADRRTVRCHVHSVHGVHVSE